MKKNLIPLLSFFLLLPTFGNLIIYTTFKINQDNIAKTICAQRKVANNSCQGHCALKKSLKKLDENERKMNSFSKVKIELEYVDTNIDTNIPTLNDFYIAKSLIFHSIEKPISIAQSSFRPPAHFV